jgi:hypothetical protein
MLLGTIHTLSGSPGQLMYSCHQMRQFLILQMAIDQERPGFHICDRWKYKLWKSENIQKVGLKGVCFKVTHLIIEVLQGCRIASAYNVLGSAVRVIMLLCLHTHTHARARARQCAVHRMYSIYRMILNYIL